MEYILEGSVLRQEQRLRIDVQLVRVRDDFAIWSGRYDRELRDVMTLQDEISRGILNTLRLKLGRGRRRYDINAKAYDLYLRALSLGDQQGIVGVNQSVSPLRNVIALEPDFAPAYAALAEVHAARSMQFKFNVPEELANLRATADKAIQLDPLLAEAQAIQGERYACDAQWQQAEQCFREAVRIDPNRSMTHMDFVFYVLMPLGRFPEALQQARAGLTNDPLSASVKEMTSTLLIAAGNYQEAVRVARMLPSDNGVRTELLGRALVFEEKTGEAIQIFQGDYEKGQSAGSALRGDLAFCYARAGRLADARKIAAETPDLNPYNQARIAAGFGDKEATLKALERAASAGPVRLGRTLTEPEMAFLKGDPRLKALRRKVGLPD